MDLEKLRRLLQETCKLDPARPLVVGVSGGPDSLTLMDVLDRLGYRVQVAHFDHSLRPESHWEAQHIQELASARGLPARVERADVAAFARQERLSIEEAARILRYRFLFSIARQVGAQAVAVGHTADDQVETVLMHFLRGAGLAGLKGMNYRSLLPEWDEHIPLVRPLLNTWREEILAYCDERQLQPVFDKSNNEMTFFRNRLRQELIPLLKGYNPRIKEVVWRTAQTLGEDYILLADATRQAWQAVCLEEGPGWVALSSPVLQALPLGLQRRVVRQAIESLLPDLRDIDFEVVERALAFVASSRSRQADLVRGLQMARQGQRLYVIGAGATVRQEDWPQMDENEEQALPVPGRLALAAGWVLQSELLPERAAGDLSDWQEEDPFQAWLDYESLSLPLRVRTRRPGDRFQPLGMEGHTVKLSDFWINADLARWARPRWPLVFAAERLAWVPGFRPAHFAQVLPATRQVLHLTLRRADNPAEAE